MRQPQPQAQPKQPAIRMAAMPPRKPAMSGMPPGGQSPPAPQDTVPAMLQPNEFVLPVAAVETLAQRFGPEGLEALRQGRLPTDPEPGEEMPQGYAEGGLINGYDETDGLIGSAMQHAANQYSRRPPAMAGQGYGLAGSNPAGQGFGLSKPYHAPDNGIHGSFADSDGLQAPGAQRVLQGIANSSRSVIDVAREQGQPLKSFSQQDATKGQPAMGYGPYLRLGFAEGGVVPKNPYSNMHGNFGPQENPELDQLNRWYRGRVQAHDFGAKNVDYEGLNRYKNAPSGPSANAGMGGNGGIPPRPPLTEGIPPEGYPMRQRIGSAIGSVMGSNLVKGAITRGVPLAAMLYPPNVGEGSDKPRRPETLSGADFEMYPNWSTNTKDYGFVGDAPIMRHQGADMSQLPYSKAEPRINNAASLGGYLADRFPNQKMREANAEMERWAPATGPRQARMQPLAAASPPTPPQKPTVETTGFARSPDKPHLPDVTQPADATRADLGGGSFIQYHPGTASGQAGPSMLGAEVGNMLGDERAMKGMSAVRANLEAGKYNLTPETPEQLAAGRMMQERGLADARNIADSQGRVLEQVLRMRGGQGMVEAAQQQAARQANGPNEQPNPANAMGEVALQQFMRNPQAAIHGPLQGALGVPATDPKRAMGMMILNDQNATPAEKMAVMGVRAPNTGSQASKVITTQDASGTPVFAQSAGDGRSVNILQARGIPDNGLSDVVERGIRNGISADQVIEQLKASGRQIYPGDEAAIKALYASLSKAS